MTSRDDRNKRSLLIHRIKDMPQVEIPLQHASTIQQQQKKTLDFSFQDNCIGNRDENGSLGANNPTAA